MARANRCSSLPLLVAAAFVAATTLDGVAALRSLYVAFEARHPILDRDAYLGSLSDWTHAPASSVLAANVSAHTDAASGALLFAAAESDAFSALYMTPAHLQLAGASATRYTPLHADAAARVSLRGCTNVLRFGELEAAQANASADCRALRAATFALGGNAGASHFMLEYRVRLRALGADRASGVRALALGLIDASVAAPFAAFALGVTSGTPVSQPRALRTFLYLDGDNCSRCETLAEARAPNCLSVVPVAASGRPDAVAAAYADASSRLTPWLLVRAAFLGDSQQVYLSTLALVYNASEAAYRVLDQTKTPGLLVPTRKSLEKPFFPYSSGDAVGWMPAVGLATARGYAEVRGFRVFEYDARAMAYTGGPLTRFAEEDARANSSSSSSSSSGGGNANDTSSTSSTASNTASSTSSTASNTASSTSSTASNTASNVNSSSSSSSGSSRAPSTPSVVTVTTGPFTARHSSIADDETSALLVLVAALALCLTLAACCSFAAYTRTHARVLLERRVAHEQRTAVWADTELQPVHSSAAEARQQQQYDAAGTSSRYNSFATSTTRSAHAPLLCSPLETYNGSSLAQLAQETRAATTIVVRDGDGGSDDGDDDDD